MVSIPDWSRFSRMGEVAPKVVQTSKYQLQREREAIREAEEHGYFFVPNKTFLLQTFCDKQDKEENKKLVRIKYIKLPGLHLRSLGDIGQCTRLRVLVLNSNFIHKLEDLAACKELIKLDLHNNQLSTLPGSAFWSCLRKLKLLYLHDNPIGRIDNLQHLAGCPNLQALTLYDTPLSLKKNYRHHVVNSLWNLKALDYYVISDEEIIEDAVFGGRFASMSPAFRIDLWRPLAKDSSYRDEVASIKSLLSDLNRILAHYSPVLIAQKMIRGYLTRKRYRLIQDTRVWGAVSIQRFYRNYKGLPQYSKESHRLPPPPSPSPIFDKPPSASIPPSRPQSVEIRVEYDEYMKNRRPGSTTALSEITAVAAAQKPTSPEPAIVEKRSEGSSSASKKKRSLHINLSKLQSGTLQNLQDETTAVEVILSARDGTQLGMVRSETDLKKKKRKKKEDDEKPKKVVKSVKQFFGPVVQSTVTPEPPVKEEEEEEEIPVTAFRLRGLPQKIHEVDPLAEVILSRKEAGRDVRVGEADIHKQLDNMPRPKVTPRQTINKDRHGFMRMQGTMGLSCLHAVQQAYKDRERAEKMALKMENILSMRETKEHAKERVRMYHEEKRANALKQREKDHMKMIELMERRELQYLNYIDKTHERRNKTTTFSKGRNAELTFVSDFNTQHTSVSNALMRHDRQAKKEDTLTENAEAVHTTKEQERNKQELVDKYLEHRKLMRQTESTMARTTLDTKILQETNERIMEARARVAKLKTRKKQVQDFYPLPSVSTVPEGESPLPAMPGISRWETSILMHKGRVGKHPTMLSS
ncbi:uncharacterized protein LOC112041805 [Lingula anatina]|uniref:Uncharacterized protein LOC112041805 n=1 Tax=Lingula anatina TaxID=7574 RepID=A0A2R2MLY3_LINAN|nr:uncharacterized protein LOC112041805 [Lingula anatina]|eukprot:XP_023931226.1 uncharacterized protein LOC112041805 [Lingula anatina]